jgi:formylglycine-generating enzyme required for sulfatase activity
MGSPPDEPDRNEEEGPQQIITFKEGYWLFDTPCTQALWEALLGETPSHFQDPQRPVERVSWEDIQVRFLPALNDCFDRIKSDDPGRFVLPSEAQWEYACRAGSTTAIYTGPIEIREENATPALDPIAWYLGNSGKDFDLKNGDDTSDWFERQYAHLMQYAHLRAGTRKVKGKNANPWGLYDMLGNVWEWTADAWHDSHTGANPDGSPRQGETGADRVYRGGSWIIRARSCRSAIRSGEFPDLRDHALGFRCARIQT